MKKRTILFSSMAAILAAALAIGGTAAYFTSKTAPVTNTFTVGGITIELVENTWENGIGEAPAGKTVAQKMAPGETANKDPVVRNTGVSPCYVRLEVTGVTCDGTTIEAPAGFTIGGAKLGTESNEWTYRDGYFYYNRTLAGANGTAIDSTVPLFTSVGIAPTAVEGDVERFDMVIMAEAVQCEGGFEPGSSFIDSAVNAFTAQMPASDPV